MTYRSGPVTETDAVAIVPVLRQASRDELMAIGDEDFPATVMRLVAASSHDYCGADDAGPLFIGGASALWDEPDTAIVWMLLTERVTQHRVFALREMRRQAVLMSGRWRVLRNCTEDRHQRTQAWLQWLGFTIGAPMPHPHTGRLVRPFERHTEHV